MNYVISWHPKAAKYVENLPKHIVKRILEKFDELLDNPFRYLEHFEGRAYKFRIGEYRALIDIDFQRRLLKVQVFDKRGRIY